MFFFRFLITSWFIGTVYCSDVTNEDEQDAYMTACGQATFTFEVNTPETPPFYVHFTNHSLPLSDLNPHTQALIKEANTVVMECFPLEDEPLDQLAQAHEIFQKYCIDTAFHKEFQDYMKGMHFPYYEKLKKIYEESIKERGSALPLMCNEYNITFEEISPRFILHMGMRHKISRLKNQEDSMDFQIDDSALINRKVRTGLESILQKFILFIPKIIPMAEELYLERKEEINQQLYAQLYYANHLKENTISQKKDEESENRWQITYKEGRFFQNAFDSDQENTQDDSDFVVERNIIWFPRIEEIIRSPDRYPTPSLICMGSGHHDILRLFEEKGYTLKILNRNNIWYPFPYTTLYKRFRGETSLIIKR